MYVIYLNALRLGRDAFRVTITSIMLFQGVTRMAGYALMGLYDRHVLMLLAAALPTMLLGSWLGARLIRRVNAERFNLVIGVVLLVSGGALLIK